MYSNVAQLNFIHPNKFPSSLNHREDDGGGLDDTKNRRGEERDAETRSNLTVHRDLRIRSDVIHVHLHHNSSLLRSTLQTADQFDRSGQTAAAANILLLRHG